MAALPSMKLLLILCLAVPLALCHAFPTFPVGPCHNLVATNRAGLTRTVNFDELTSMTTAQPFEAWDAPKAFSYKWSICTNNGHGLGGHGAMQGNTSFGDVSLGTYPDPPPAFYNTSYPMGAIEFTLDQSNQGRVAVITVVCDPTAVYVDHSFDLSCRCVLPLCHWNGGYTHSGHAQGI